MLNRDFREMLSALLDAEVEFIIVGAFALAAHGNPRSTGDIDIFVNPTTDNAIRLFAALTRFGAPLAQIEKTDFEKPDLVFQIGLPPRRIDILTSLEGISGFEEANNSKVTARVGDLDLPVLGRDTLIKNKTALGRPQDVADVAWLKANSP